MTTTVRRQSKARNAARLVLLTLADSADDHGLAWPSVGTLKADTLLSERAVQNALTALVAAGELVIELNAGPRGCNRYRVTLVPSDPRRICTPAESAPPQNLPGPPQISTPTPAESAPEPPETHQEPPPPPTPGAPADLDGIDMPKLCTDVRAARTAAGLGTARWTERRIAAALVEAHAEGMPASALTAAMLEVAVLPDTRVPGRLLVAGPWWDAAEVHDLAEARRIAAERRAACQCAGTGLIDLDDGRVTKCPQCRPTRKSAAQ
jgi:hypothetical protein